MNAMPRQNADLCLFKKPSCLYCVQVFDKDITQDKKLGVVKLPLVDLEADTLKEHELRLLPSLDMLKIKDKKDRGTLTVKVHIFVNSIYDRLFPFIPLITLLLRSLLGHNNMELRKIAIFFFLVRCHECEPSDSRLQVLYHEYTKEEQQAALEEEKRILEEKRKLKEAGVLGSTMDAFDGAASVVGSGVGMVGSGLGAGVGLVGSGFSKAGKFVGKSFNTKKSTASSPSAKAD